MVASVIVTAAWRLLRGTGHIHGLPVLIASAVAAGLMILGAVILATGGWYWLDPTVALIIATVIGYHVVVLLRDVAEGLRAPELT